MKKKYAALSIASIVTVLATSSLQVLEGTKLESYPDPVQKWTICSGVTYILGVGPVKPGMKLTEVQCRDLDQAVTSGFVYGVAKLIRPPISIETNVAHVIFAYNIGIHGYAGSQALKRTNAGDLMGGCIAMRNWSGLTKNGTKYDCRKHEYQQKIDGCRGLMNRREAEVNQCLMGLE